MIAATQLKDNCICAALGPHARYRCFDAEGWRISRVSGTAGRDAVLRAELRRAGDAATIPARLPLHADNACQNAIDVVRNATAA
jgi:hypothetical protein